MKVLRRKNPSEPTGEATELVTRYFRKPKYAKGRAWLEEHLGQQRLFQYNPSIVTVQSIGSGKYGMFVMNQLVKKGTKAVCNAYAKTLKAKESRNAKRNPHFEQDFTIKMTANSFDDYYGQKIFTVSAENEIHALENAKAYCLNALGVNPNGYTFEVLKGTNETEMHNFDDESHDVIFADDSDDVIFANDEMLTNPFGIGDAIKRRVNRYRAGRAYKQGLKHQARADRAKQRQSDFAQLATQNPQYWKGYWQNFFSIAPQNDGTYQIQNREGIPVLDWETRKPKVYYSYPEALQWLENWEEKEIEAAEQLKKNPAWLANATNALVGLASAAQIREHLQKQSRRKVTKKPTTKRKAKRNPHGDIFEEFTGRQATTTTEMPVSHLAPVKLDKLGDLVEIHLTDGRKLEFNPNSRNHQVWLCAANKKQMWITGTTVAQPNSALKDHEIEPIGEIDKIVYHAFKPVVGDDKPEYYIHELGEWSGEKPILAADKNGFPVIYGGNYSIEARGIVD